MRRGIYKGSTVWIEPSEWIELLPAKKFSCLNLRRRIISKPFFMVKQKSEKSSGKNEVNKESGLLWKAVEENKKG